MGEHKTWLCQPQTFMNESGRAAAKVCVFFKLPVERLLVVADDADLPCGTIRMRPSGGNGGHHGLESVERHLGTRDYARLRIGIGRTPDSSRQITNYVLGRFRDDEAEVFAKALERACGQIACWLLHGIAKAMNDFNGTVNVPKTETN